MVFNTYFLDLRLRRDRDAPLGRVIDGGFGGLQSVGNLFTG